MTFSFKSKQAKAKEYVIRENPDVKIKDSLMFRMTKKNLKQQFLNSKSNNASTSRKISSIDFMNSSTDFKNKQNGDSLMRSTLSNGVLDSQAVEQFLFQSRHDASCSIGWTGL